MASLPNHCDATTVTRESETMPRMAAFGVSFSSWAIARFSLSIRRFRQEVFTAEPDSPLQGLCGMRDFYSMSMCRDLVFNVQEHQFTLPQIADMLRAQGLAVVGMANDMPRDAVAAYRQLNPRDQALADFDALDKFEAQHPSTFAGMFPFWCRLADRK